jgi:single-strand DNA-binding protein
MKNSLTNSVQLIGNVGNNPVLKTLNNGNKVAQFQIATNNQYVDNNGNKIKNTQWHNVVAWNKTADIIDKYVNKGKHVLVKGSLNHRSYENNQGDTIYITEVLVEDIVFI